MGRTAHVQVMLSPGLSPGTSHPSYQHFGVARRLCLYGCDFGNGLSVVHRRINGLSTDHHCGLQKFWGNGMGGIRLNIPSVSCRPAFSQLVSGGLGTVSVNIHWACVTDPEMHTVLQRTSYLLWVSRQSVGITVIHRRCSDPATTNGAAYNWA